MAEVWQETQEEFVAKLQEEVQKEVQEVVREEVAAEAREKVMEKKMCVCVCVCRVPAIHHRLPIGKGVWGVSSASTYIRSSYVSHSSPKRSTTEDSALDPLVPYYSCALPLGRNHTIGLAPVAFAYILLDVSDIRILWIFHKECSRGF